VANWTAYSAQSPCRRARACPVCSRGAVCLRRFGGAKGGWWCETGSCAPGVRRRPRGADATGRLPSLALRARIRSRRLGSDSHRGMPELDGRLRGCEVLGGIPGRHAPGSARTKANWDALASFRGGTPRLCSTTPLRMPTLEPYAQSRYVIRMRVCRNRARMVNDGGLWQASAAVPRRGSCWTLPDRIREYAP